MKRALPLGLLVACNGGGKTSIDTPKTSDPAGHCAVSAAVDGAAQGVAVAVDRSAAGAAFDVRQLQMRPLTVEAAGGATVLVSGGIGLFDEAGTALGAESTLGASEQPQILWIEGLETGAGQVELRPIGVCPSPAVVVDVAVRPALELVGHGLTGFPGFGFANAFNVDETVEIGLDARDFPDRVGGAFDAYVVAHRSPAEWAADRSLVDAGDGPVAGTLADGGRSDNRVALWSSDLAVPAGSVSADYDVVLDFDRDGELDNGEPIDGLGGPGFTAIRDLAEAGPYAPVISEHSTGFWTTMRVYAPNTILVDPAPLVVISHGNGHDYTWYDYLGNHLASWGYVVISHRNDTGPGVITAASTTLQNTEVFLADWPTLGLPVDVDGHNIAWIGHSRGGEGIVIAYKQLVNGANVTQFGASDVHLLQSIAPTNFEGPDGADPKDAPFHILSGSADGDVTGGVDSGLLQYYRMFQRGTGDHWVTYVQGADHNDFNCCGDDDSQWFSVQGNPPVIGRQRAQEVAKSYLLALLEHELRGTPGMDDYLERSPEQYRPISADATVATQSMPADDKWVLDDFQTNPTPDQSSSGGAVTNNATLYGEGALDDNNTQLTWSDNDQTNGMTWSNNDASPERGAMVEWSTGEDVSIDWEVPAGSRDWTGFRTLSFRSCQGTRNPKTVGLSDMASFTVALLDSAGNEVGIDFASYGRVTQPYPRAGLGNGNGWINEFQTVAIPLVDFGAGDPRVDLTDIATLRFRFGSAWGSAQGRAGFDDIELLEQ